MQAQKKRIMALIGVILLLTLFILTIVFLAIGKTDLAILFVGLNGFVAVILYFLGKFNQNAKDANDRLSIKDEEK